MLIPYAGVALLWWEILVNLNSGGVDNHEKDAKFIICYFYFVYFSLDAKCERYGS